MNRDKLIEFYYIKEMTLAAIGKLYGVTRERVRQWMEKENLKRRRGTKRFSSPQEYFEYVKQTGRESLPTLRRFISSRKKQCNDCGSTANLHEHHLIYPATSFDDIQILCASCHFAKHNKGNGKIKQLEICEKYITGKSGCEIAKECGVYPTVIYHFLRKWGIQRRSRGWKRNKLSPEERNQKKKAYYWGNRNRLLAYKREHYQENKEEIKARRRQRYWNKKLALVN